MVLTVYHNFHYLFGRLFAVVIDHHLQEKNCTIVPQTGRIHLENICLSCHFQPLQTMDPVSNNDEFIFALASKAKMAEELDKDLALWQFEHQFIADVTDLAHNKNVTVEGFCCQYNWQKHPLSLSEWSPISNIANPMAMSWHSRSTHWLHSDICFSYGQQICKWHEICCISLSANMSLMPA